MPGFFLAVFRQIWALPRRNPYKYAYGASFVAAVCHYAVVSDIWYPWLWFLCTLVAGEWQLIHSRADPEAEPTLGHIRGGPTRDR